MNLAQYIPQWLRSRLQKPAPQSVRNLSKKDLQILPTVPKAKHPSILFQQDASPAGYRVLWRI